MLDGSKCVNDAPGETKCVNGAPDGKHFANRAPVYVNGVLGETQLREWCAGPVKLSGG